MKSNGSKQSFRFVSFSLVSFSSRSISVIVPLSSFCVFVRVAETISKSGDT